MIMQLIDLSDRKTYRQIKERSTQTLCALSPGENAGNGGDDWANAAIPAISPPLPLRTHPVPEDSALARYRNVLRGISEAPDSWLVAPILAVAACLLTPAVSLDFGGPKPLTLYQFIAGAAGLRKSTSTTPAERVAARILQRRDFVTGNASDSALFDSFEKNPHRLQIEDEGNTLVRTWSNGSFGREVAARYLKLYDGQAWGQNFRREAEDHEDGEAERRIAFASLSLVVASTFGVSRFDGVDAASGLRRRFGYYVEYAPARQIDWPSPFDDRQIDELAALFRPLTEVKGIISGNSFTPDGWAIWKHIQKENRAAAQQIAGVTASDEAAGAALSESPMRVLKLAVIFQACRWLCNTSLNPLELNAECLQTAHQHQQDCLAAAAELDTVGQRAVIADRAESTIARIRSDYAGQFQNGWITLNRTQLTNKFASHTERTKAVNPTRLYGEIIPHLIRQGKAREIPQKGKKHLYAFSLED